MFMAQLCLSRSFVTEAFHEERVKRFLRYLALHELKSAARVRAVYVGPVHQTKNNLKITRSYCETNKTYTCPIMNPTRKTLRKFRQLQNKGLQSL
jgi:hypothetical protein